MKTALTKLLDWASPQNDLESEWTNVRMRRVLAQDAPVGPRFPCGAFTIANAGGDVDGFF